MCGCDLSVARRLVLLRLLLRFLRFLGLGRLISFGLGRGLGTGLGSLGFLLLGLRCQPRRLRLRTPSSVLTYSNRRVSVPMPYHDTSR